jgi:RND family efflux transporter MFP subunit
LEVKLALADEDDFTRSGTINFVDNKVDPLTGTLRERAVFPNKDGLLSPGMFARIRRPIGHEHQAILVPEMALGTDQGNKFLFIVNQDNAVERRPVKTGSLHGQWRVIEDDGVKMGERIVVNGLQRVRQGTKVETKLVDFRPEDSAPPAAGIAPKD